ncbi:MAG: 30S ribosomal protein S4 [Kiritimatiellia bacterium]|jgi:small subunit ribosomal protein S4
MGRYTGAVCRRCRREGMKLNLKGARCYMAKCPIDQGRSVPGVHGQRRVRKISNYGLQLREKQRLRHQYGLQEGQFRRVFKTALQRRGITGETMLQLLETRLDNIVYRLGFAPSRAAARQFVRHGHVTVNGHKANIPSMVLKPGDVVQVRDRDRSKEFAKQSYEGTASARLVPSWLSVDADKLRGEVLSIPTREEIAPIVNEQLIVELYSR